MENQKRMAGVVLSLLVQLLFLTMGLPHSAQAAWGDLDPSFGTGGEVVTDFVSYNESSVAIQADRKIVVAGTAYNGTNWDFALARYNADGSLDPNFGTGGIVMTDFAYNDNAALVADSASSVAIQADGKIIAVGDVFNGTNSDFALARYNADGSLDTSFGTDGRVTTNFVSGYADPSCVKEVSQETDIASSSDAARSLAIQADGKIVIAGSVSPPSYCGYLVSTNYDFALARYNTDGSLDTSFGIGGKVMTDFASSDDEAYSVVIQNGKIIAAGYASNGSNRKDFALARYNADGSLDPSFGTGGKVTTDFASSYDYANSVAIQADGKIMVVGSAVNGINSWDFALARYNADGSLDSSFGTGGKVTTDFASSYDYANSVAIQADGKIIAAGSANNGTNDFALARYNADGSLDPGFGTGGKVTTDFASHYDYADSVAIQADGKIIVAGNTFNGTNNNFALARYLVESPNPSPGGTMPGSNVTVQPVDPNTNTSPVTLTFDNVTRSGSTTVTTSGTGTPPPNGFKLGNPPVYYHIETTAGFDGQVHVCISYSGISFGNENDLRLFHETSTGWQDATDPGYPDTVNKVICGTVSSFSLFGVFEEQGYSFTGFLPPLENPPVQNAAKAGQTIPVKWQLLDGSGGYISNPAVVSATLYRVVACNGSGSGENQVPAETSGASGLRYDFETNQFIYNWKTDKSWTGKCYTFTLRFDDGSEHSAYFSLK
ncbi:MAG: hypothetical protein A2075_07560 [Geobacteraceae bacterium GWC2_58_44]|nr:MAG: hypothetical protein A2075_07560 [Geobacteraceae bacterium GWC2_58_44]